MFYWCKRMQRRIWQWHQDQQIRRNQISGDQLSKPWSVQCWEWILDIQWTTSEKARVHNVIETIALMKWMNNGMVAQRDQKLSGKTADQIDGWPKKKTWCKRLRTDNWTKLGDAVLIQQWMLLFVWWCQFRLLCFPVSNYLWSYYMS